MFCLLADNDYTLDSESNSLRLSFANGTANGAIENVPITVLDDLILEGTENIVLFASTQPELSASFVTGKNTIVISILDNDGKLVFVFKVLVLYIQRLSIHIIDL